jgi:predicted ABC-type ATPase
MSEALFVEESGVPHYVNADLIAKGLSAFRSEDMALEAGRVMLDHLKKLAAQRASFAFETTLATRSFAPWVQELQRGGYYFRLIYLWLPSPEMAVQRVRDRVLNGGHNIPEDTIRRRYQRGVNNFFGLYQPIADSWKFYNNSNPRNPTLLAEGNGTIEKVIDAETWGVIKPGGVS